MFAAVAVARRLGGEKAVPAIPRITLNNGVQMPMLSLGIWQFSNDEVATAVKQALSVGIDHFDASIFYGTPENDGQPNQPALGRALAGIPRSQYFLLTKIDPSYMDSDEYSIVTEKFTRSNAYYRTLEQAAHNLGDLGLEYVDVMLVHWSMSDCVVMQETWRAMEEVHRLGWAKAIGVSNYCPNTLQCILSKAKIVPAINQVLYHVGMEAPIAPLNEFSGPHDIKVQAYSPLGSGGKHHSNDLISGPLVTSIGAAHGKTGAQVALRYLAQRGVPFSTKSLSAQHMRESMDVFNFELSDDEMQQLDAYVSDDKAYSFTCDCKATGSCGEHGGGYESPYA